MNKFNYRINILIIIILSTLFITCPTQGSKNSEGRDDNKQTGFQNIWTNLNPSVPIPSAREDHSMVYVENDKIILFGGIDAIGRSDETWEYDILSNIWTNLNPVTKPSAREDHSMVYVGNDRVILFGGVDSIDYNNETWKYNVILNTWSSLGPLTPIPSARSGHSMIYVGNDKIILFGGYNSIGYNNETWEYDVVTNTWTNLNPVVSPSARVIHTMAYIGNNKVILFGGYNGFLNDETWEYDITSNTWTNLNPSAPIPTVRGYHSMVYIGNNKIIVFGGHDGAFDNETWEYDVISNLWSNLNPTTKPSARYKHSMVYVRNNKIILFGGVDSIDYNNETWEYK